jgi:hypothetical protein
MEAVCIKIRYAGFIIEHSLSKVTSIIVYLYKFIYVNMGFIPRIRCIDDKTMVYIQTKLALSAVYCR